MLHFQYLLFALFATHILFIFVLKLTKILLKYDPPRLYQSKKAEWYVGAWIYHPNGVDKYRFRRKNGISVTGISRTERIKRGNALCNKILEQLKAGLINPWPELEAAAVEEKIPEITVSAALLEALEHKKPYLKTHELKLSYTNTIDRYILWLHKLGYAGMRLVDFKKRFAVEVLERMQLDDKFGNASYNTYKIHLSSVFSVLADIKEYIPINPFHRVPRKKTVKSTKFKPPTDLEQEAIDNYLYTIGTHPVPAHELFKRLNQTGWETWVAENILAVGVPEVDYAGDYLTIPFAISITLKYKMKGRKAKGWVNSFYIRPRLFLLKSLIFLAGTRENELLGLRANQINWEAKTARLISADVKNSKDKDIVLTDELIDLLRDHLKNHIGNPYVFSLQLAPGGKRISITTLNNYWRIIIKEGLGIDSNLYAQKGAGGNKKRKAGVSIDTLMKTFGHGSRIVTEIYLSEETQIAHTEIREKAPSILANIKKAK